MLFSVFVLLSSIALYYNSLQGGYVWDDRAAIIKNPDIRNGSIFNLLRNDFWGQDIKLVDSHKSFRPVTVLSFRINYSLHGLEPYGYHAVNTIIYALACFSFWRFTSQWLNADGSKLATILFIFHPIHAESVASLVGRADALCGLFCCLAMIFYSISVRKSVKTLLSFLVASLSFGCSLVCTVAASLSKEIGVTVFGLLVVLEVAEHMRSISNATEASSSGGLSIFFRSLKLTLTTLDSSCRIVSVITLLAVFSFIRLQLNGSHRLYKWTILENHISLVEDFQTRALSYAQMHFWYIFKLVYPRYLCFDYGYSCIPLVRGILDWRNLLPLLTYSTVLWTIIRAFLQARVALLVGSAVLLLPLLPAVNILFPVGTLLAERLLFVPSMGFCIIIADFLTVDSRSFWTSTSQELLDPIVTFVMSSSNDANGKRTKYASTLGTKLPYIFIAPIVGVWSVWVIRRNVDWSSETKLYASALKVCPQSLKALTNHALLAMADKKYDVAVDSARRAIRIYGNQTAALVNAGVAYNRLYRFGSSVNMLQRALLADPSSPKANGYLGTTLYDWASSLASEGNPALNQEVVRRLSLEAIYYSERAVALGFDAPSILHAIGSMSMDLGMHEKAVHYLETALENSIKLRRFRGGGSLHAPVEDDINYAYTYNQLGNVYRHLGQVERAIDAFQRGLAIDPHAVPIITNLGVLYKDIMQLAKAKEVFTQGLAVYPEGGVSQPPAALLNNVALVELELGNYSSALAYLQRALSALRGGQGDIATEGRAIAMDGAASVEEVILSNIAKVNAKMFKNN